MHRLHKEAQAGTTISMDKSRFYTKDVPQGRARGGHRLKLGVSRDTVYKYARMEDLSPEPPKARKSRPSKMDRWAPLVDSGSPTTSGRTGRGTRRTGSGAGSSTSGADVSADRQALCEEARLRLGGGLTASLDLDWPAGVAQVDFATRRSS